MSAHQSKTSAHGTAASGEVSPSRAAAASGEGRSPATAANGSNRAAPVSDRLAPAGRDPESGAPASRDPVAVRGFIERFTAQLTQAGFPRTPARIFVALLTSDSSKLTAAELAELLQASPASISGGVRYLIQVGLVAAEGEPGSRRQHYWMSERVWQDIVRLRDRQFTRWAAELQEGVRILGADSPAGARMANTIGYFEFISSEMAGLLARWDSRIQAADSG
ncbi:MAG TPA: MarR family transcriptional regulator [Streptosporangiaceae bacterium]|nr:MarR family transcriptional regulator [Streptosporangiaceae bacterium]